MNKYKGTVCKEFEQALNLTTTDTCKNWCAQHFCDFNSFMIVKTIPLLIALYAHLQLLFEHSSFFVVRAYLVSISQVGI